MLKGFKVLATGALLSAFLVACTDEETDKNKEKETSKGNVTEQVVDVDKDGDVTIGEDKVEETKVNERTKVEVTEMLVRETLGEFNAGVGKSFLIIKYTITNDNDLPLKIDSLVKNAEIEHVYKDGDNEVKEVFPLDPEAQKVYLETEGKNDETIVEGTELPVGDSASSQYVFKFDTTDWATEGHDYNLLLNGSSAKINN